MKLYIRKPTGGLGTLTRSVRITKPRLNSKIPVRKSIIGLVMVVLNMATMAMGQTLFNFPLHYLIILLDVLGVLCIRHMGDLEYGMDLMPFVATLVVTLVFQLLLAGPYYNGAMAASTVILLFAMVVCIMLVMQRHYGYLIWKVINFFNLFSALCILLQMAAMMAGLRLDRMGAISDWFFNAWEFSTAFRPCGTYPEPAMFAQPALLSLFYYLFIGRSWIKVLILCAALLLSTSVLGLLGMVVLLLIWCINLDKFFPIQQRTKWALLVMGTLGIAGALALALSADLFIVQRLFSGSSVGVRALRSVDLYKLMSPIEKIIGIGIQNQQNYLNYYGIILAHDTYETTIGANREFAGSLGYTLCTTGFFGLVFLVRPFYRAFVRYGLEVKTVALLLLYSGLFCAMLGNTILMTYILAVYATIDMTRDAAAQKEAAHGE